MGNRTWRGHWWLPSSPDNTAPGQLVISEDGSCELQLVGGLDMGEQTSRRLGERVSAIYGESRGRPITLLDCFISRRDGFSHRDSSYQDVHIHEALIGVHVAAEEEAFQCAIVTIEHLTSWLNAETSLERDGDDDVESVTARRPSNVSCTFDGWTYTARALLQPFQVSAERGRLGIGGEISSYLVIRPPSPVTADAFLGPVLEFMDLLTLASGEPSGRIELTLVHKDPIQHPNGDGTTFELERRAESYGSRIHTARPSEPAADAWKFLFSCADREFEEIVPTWLSLRRRAAAACNVYFGMRYARPTFTEVRLLMTAVTAETLHESVRGDTTELPKETFSERRDRVLAMLPDADEREWAKRKLRNEPSFRERLLDLASVPDATAVETIVSDLSTWSRSLRDARNNLAHTGNEKTDEDIYYLERVTSSLLTLVFMSELGLSADVQQRAATRVLEPLTPTRRDDR